MWIPLCHYLTTAGEALFFCPSVRSGSSCVPALDNAPMLLVPLVSLVGYGWVNGEGSMTQHRRCLLAGGLARSPAAILHQHWQHLKLTHHTYIHIVAAGHMINHPHSLLRAPPLLPPPSSSPPLPLYLSRRPHRRRRHYLTGRAGLGGVGADCLGEWPWSQFMPATRTSAASVPHVLGLCNASECWFKTAEHLLLKPSTQPGRTACVLLCLCKVEMQDGDGHPGTRHNHTLKGAFDHIIDVLWPLPWSGPDERESREEWVAVREDGGSERDHL